MGSTLNFIDIWLKLFEDNYDARCVAYITATKEMFNQIPQTVVKSLTPKQKFRTLWQILLVNARCGAYVNDMKDIFKQITQTMPQPLTPKKSPETYDRYWWWMVYGKIAKGLPPLIRPKLSKRAQ